jgi:hypothetical protein
VIKKYQSTRRHNILNLYAPNNRVINYARKKIIKVKRETGISTIIVGSTKPLSKMELARKSAKIYKNSMT